MVEVEHVHDPGDAGLVGPAAGVARECYRPRGGAVVGAVAGEDLVTPGHGSGDADGVLVGLGAPEGEERLLDVAGEQLGELAAEQRPGLGGGDGGVGVSERFGLARDRLDDAGVPMADVHAHELAVEVQVALAVGVVEVDALGPEHRYRRDLRLRCPVVEGVAPRPLDDLLGGQPLRLGFGAHLDLLSSHVDQHRRAGASLIQCTLWALIRVNYAHNWHLGLRSAA